jgi:predicted PurR-regulated permease PerM
MITSKTIANGILRAITVIVLTALLLYFHQISSVLVYLIVALILTLIGNPVLDFFTRRLKLIIFRDYRDVILS